MSTTVLQLWNNVRTTLNLSTSDTTTYTSAEVLRVVNSFINLVAARGYRVNTEVALAVTTSTRKYTVNARLQSIEMAWVDGDQQTMQRITPDEIGERGLISQTGKPQYFYEEEESIVLFPFPDTSYTVRCLAIISPGSMSATSDTIPLPDLYVDALHEWCVAAFLLREQDPSAQGRMAAAESMLSAALAVDAAKRNRRYGGPISEGDSGTRAAPRFYVPW